MRRRRRRGMMAGGGGLGLVALVVLLALGVFGHEAFDYQSPFDRFPQVQPGTARAATPTSPKENLDAFLRNVSGDVQSFWAGTLGDGYQPARFVTFHARIQTGCGTATDQVGPFYCPVDATVYLDESFFTQLANQFRAPGDFAQAYVVAHEFGHHVQNLTGISSQVQQAQAGNPGDANRLSIELELQADCFAGVWAYSTYKRGLLEQGDLQEGLRAAAAVGDDTIQERTTGQINPETWTHGSAQQRQDWFSRGFQNGNPDDCNTFGS